MVENVTLKYLPKYAESRVFFSFQHYNKKDKTNKKDLVQHIDIIFRKLEYISKRTWKEWSSLDRANGGISLDIGEMEEKVSIAMAKELRDIHRPFHFRVNSQFRVFGIQCEEYCMVIYIDPTHKRQ